MLGWFSDTSFDRGMSGFKNKVLALIGFVFLASLLKKLIRVISLKRNIPPADLDQDYVFVWKVIWLSIFCRLHAFTPYI